VAQKALRVNLSDLAAKGARPLGYLLSLALPKDWTEPQLADFAAGLGEDQATYGISLLGGDTIRSPKGLIITITVIGAVPSGRMARRGGTRAGDRIFVSGTIGDAALGLQLRLDDGLAARLALSSRHAAHLLDRYLLPRPRLSLADAVVRHAAGSMDISDGLVLDLTRMCRVSGVGARVALPAVPLSDAARAMIAADPAMLGTVLTGGDDYELLVAVPLSECAAFEAAAREAGCPVTAIGEALPGKATVRLVDVDGADVDIGGLASGFSHF
jgi:thiamine-monophosphate kinase